MKRNSIATRDITAIGLMLFALFFGAGNMIFPPFLGQEAGENVWPAIVGFLLTGVGLPLLGVIAIARNGDLQTLANRVHPLFSIIFSVILYLTIGPFFGIPRTGTVSYEISVTPFLTETLKQSSFPLFIYSLIFFGLTAWLSLNPSKLVDRIGKYLTPALLLIIAILIMKSLITPMGEPGLPNEAYSNTPFFKGFVEGYLTLDAIAALVFGIVVIGSIRDKGITDKTAITKACMKAGIIAATGLAIVYIALSYIGATSVSAIGTKENGASLLSDAATYLFGSTGLLILGLAITLACLTTSIGLVSSCAQYFSKILPKITYRNLVFILSIFSLIIANIGLTQLINISLPVLIMIYPIAIVLIILSYFHNFFHGYSTVYIFALIPTGFISLIDGLKTAGIPTKFMINILSDLPFYSEGIGWVVPAIIGTGVGYIIALLFGAAKKSIVS
ncbi:branched-chain amino acid transport system II carrier protein [Bacillus sp. CGMCC 1.16607]|uniref:branched-chain amino acid transport system II carrier protein n=1 Tax=Bacillus sp. CGMCC 1.16607 TaxID=3351842 RepID=UPI003638FCFA